MSVMIKWCFWRRRDLADQKTTHNVGVGPVQRLNMPDGNDRWRDAALTFNPEPRVDAGTDKVVCTAGQYGTKAACRNWDKDEMMCRY